MNKRFKTNLKGILGRAEFPEHSKEAITLLFSSVSDDDTKEHLQVVVYDKDKEGKYTQWAYATNGHILTVSSTLPMQDGVDKIKLDKATLTMLRADTGKYLMLPNHNDGLEYPNVRRVIPDVSSNDWAVILTKIPEVFSVFDGRSTLNSIVFDYDKELWFYSTTDTKYESNTLIKIDLRYMSYWAGMEVLLYIKREEEYYPMIIVPIGNYQEEHNSNLVEKVNKYINLFRDGKNTKDIINDNSHITFSVVMPLRK